VVSVKREADLAFLVDCAIAIAHRAAPGAEMAARATEIVPDRALDVIDVIYGTLRTRRD
jgi:hypothetical protein